VRLHTALVLVLLFVFSFAPAQKLRRRGATVAAAAAQLPRPPAPVDEAEARMIREQEKKANQQRFANLKKDTDRLVQLANELKEHVDKASEHQLSLEVIKKAEEIEKLAHSVKEKMKG
jgi:IS30 family transposase